MTTQERERAGRAWTPGPWKVEQGTTVIWSHNSYDPGTNCVGCIVARAAQPSSWRGSRPTANEQDANARLIAAAPELFEALADCALEIAQIRNRKLTAGEQAALDRARAALSRAGEVDHG